MESYEGTLEEIVAFLEMVQIAAASEKAVGKKFQSLQTMGEQTVHRPGLSLANLEQKIPYCGGSFKKPHQTFPVFKDPYPNLLLTPSGISPERIYHSPYYYSQLKRTILGKTGRRSCPSSLAYQTAMANPTTSDGKPGQSWQTLSRIGNNPAQPRSVLSEKSKISKVCRKFFHRHKRHLMMMRSARMSARVSGLPEFPSALSMSPIWRLSSAWKGFFIVV